MKVRLMYRDRDFLERAEIPRPDRDPGAVHGLLSPNRQALVRDLELDILFGAMAADDPFLFAIASRAVLSGVPGDLEAIRYRQAILQDVLHLPGAVRELYAIAVATVEHRRRGWWGFRNQSPGSFMASAVELMTMLVEQLAHIRGVAVRCGGRVRSEGLTRLLGTLRTELSEPYLDEVRGHLEALRFPRGALLSAELGPYAEGVGYRLRLDDPGRHGWLTRLLGGRRGAFTFALDPRDEAGANILAAIRDQGVREVASALGRAADHVLGFFEILRAELAFYVGCLNLAEELSRHGAPVTFPHPAPSGSRQLTYSGLYDVGLALTTGRRPVANDGALDGKSLVVITGANQGGKSTLLRAIGLAQLMMQCGMFVAADEFTADVCRGIVTHFKREEDPSMRHGKLDEELARMSAIADELAGGWLALFNESFAATNEREGSEIARQVSAALVSRGVKVVFVTHWYDFAHRLHAEDRPDTAFLRAERLSDGTRTFRVLPGEPLSTGFGADLYREVFEAEAPTG